MLLVIPSRSITVSAASWLGEEGGHPGCTVRRQPHQPRANCMCHVAYVVRKGVHCTQLPHSCLLRLPKAVGRGTRSSGRRHQLPSGVCGGMGRQTCNHGDAVEGGDGPGAEGSRAWRPWEGWNEGRLASGASCHEKARNSAGQKPGETNLKLMNACKEKKILKKRERKRDMIYEKVPKARKLQSSRRYSQ